MEIDFNAERDAWDGFLSGSPQRCVFAQSRFLDSLGARCDLVTAREKGRIEAGAVVVHSASGEPLDSAHPFTQYQGVFLADDGGRPPHSRTAHQHKVLERFIAALAERYKRCFFSQSWRFEDMRAFQWFNYHAPQEGTFQVRLRYSAVLRLGKYSGFEDYLGSIRSVRKQEFHKAAGALALTESTDESVLDELHGKVFGRQGLAREEGQSLLVRSITRRALADGYGSLKLALLKDKPVAATLFLYDDRTAYYLFGATDPEHRKTFAGTFLLASMIKEAFAKGVSEVDFVGVNSPNRGDFKLSFNGELVPYFEAFLRPPR